MLIDTHAHIYLDQFQEDLGDVIRRASDAAVGKILMPAIDASSIRQAIELCERYEGLYAMAALHPSVTQNATQADFADVIQACDHPRIVAVGETGLDYYWDRSFDERQHDFLRRHIRLAIEKDLPVIFHNRDAFEDLIRIVEEEKAAAEHPERLRGIFHCFTGSLEEAERVISAGFLIGIGGILTFKNSTLSDVVRETSLDWIVLETDSPFLAPHPHRGRRNEPAYVSLVAQKLADALDVSLQEVERVTTENAEQIFRLT